MASRLAILGLKNIMDPEYDNKPVKDEVILQGLM
jgi:hypothetical protein